MDATNTSKTVDVADASKTVDVADTSNALVATLDPYSWLHDAGKVRHLNDVKTMALGNARLLYGSDRNRFYDIVVSYTDADAQYAVHLMCTVDGVSKSLRKNLADCPLKAAQVLVDGLQKDTGLVFSKYDVGDRFYGQQGYHNEDGVFELDEDKNADDDHRRLDNGYRGRGHGDGYGQKRSRRDY